MECPICKRSVGRLRFLPSKDGGTWGCLSCLAVPAQKPHYTGRVIWTEVQAYGPGIVKKDEWIQDLHDETLKGEGA